MKKVDYIFVGYVVGTLKDLGTNLSRFRMLVTGAQKDGTSEVLPVASKLISVDVHTPAKLSFEDRRNLITAGSKVSIHVTGEKGAFKTEVVETVICHGSTALGDIIVELEQT